MKISEYLQQDDGGCMVIALAKATPTWPWPPDQGPGRAQGRGSARGLVCRGLRPVIVPIIRPEPRWSCHGQVLFHKTERVSGRPVEGW